MQNKTIYRNGGWRVVVMTAVYAVVGTDGTLLFKLNTVEDAVQTVDEMASAPLRQVA